MRHRQVFHCHKQFRGLVSSVPEKQSGRPVTTSTDIMINTIRTRIVDDNSLTQCEIAAHLGIAKGRV